MGETWDKKSYKFFTYKQSLCRCRRNFNVVKIDDRRISYSISSSIWHLGVQVTNLLSIQCIEETLRWYWELDNFVLRHIQFKIYSKYRIIEHNELLKSVVMWDNKSFQFQWKLNFTMVPTNECNSAQLTKKFVQFLLLLDDCGESC